LNAPYADLPTTLGTIHMRIAPKDLLGTLSEKPVGTGPFKFAEFVPGSHVRVVRNDKYFVAGQPYLDQVIYKVVPESLVAATALKRSEVDVWYPVPTDHVQDLRRAPDGNIVVQGVSTGNWDGIFVHNQRKPFS